LYCLLTVASSKVPDIKSVVAADFGQICEKLEKALKNNLLLTPEPWSLRVNQWRNIAQHHSYIVRDDSVVAMYGKAQPPKQIILSRAELLDLARELVRRLGALKSSRAITTINHIEQNRGQTTVLYHAGFHLLFIASLAMPRHARLISSNITLHIMPSGNNRQACLKGHHTARASYCAQYNAQKGRHGNYYSHSFPAPGPLPCPPCSVRYSALIIYRLPLLQCCISCWLPFPAEEYVEKAW
ncbi:MAG: hypothetical protein ABI659_04725, partial [Nitrosospira sp.]